MSLVAWYPLDEIKTYNHSHTGSWYIINTNQEFFFDFPGVPTSLQDSIKLKIYQNDLEGNVDIQVNGTLVVDGILGTDNTTEWKEWTVPANTLRTDYNKIRIFHNGGSDDWGYIYTVNLYSDIPYVEDKSKNGNEGTVIGTGIITQAGKINNACKFTGAIADYIKLPVVTMNNLFDFSVSLWVNSSNLSKSINTVFHATISGRNDFSIEMYSNRFSVIFLGNVYVFYITNVINTWSHITFRRTGSTLEMYKDGVSIGSYSANSNILNITGAIVLGQEQDGVSGGFEATQSLEGMIDDVRIYDHSLTEKEIKELSKGKVLHYKFDDLQEPTTNILKNTLYENRTYNYIYGTSSWGGDSASVIYYQTGGYNNLPYKKLIKTAPGDGGSYIDDNFYFTIEDNKTYTVSVYMKASRNVSLNGYAFSLNRSSDNAYRTTSGFSVTTEWKRFEWVYNSLTGHAGSDYQVRSIIYDDADLPLEVFWCAPQLEKKNHATPFTPTIRTGLVKDISSYENNAELTESTTPRWMEEGIIGKGSYLFNGTTEYIDKIEGNVFIEPEEITVSGWIKMDTDASTARHIWLTKWLGYSMEIEDSTRIPYFRLNGPGDIRSNTALTVGTWHHFTGTYSPISGGAVYLDGNLVGTKSANGAIVYSRSSLLNIGRYSGGVYFDGQIDDVRIYATALSSDDVKELYQTKANLDKDGNFSIKNIEATYNNFDDITTTGVYPFKTYTGNIVDTYVDTSVATHNGENKWKLVGSWDDAAEWTKTSISSSEPFLTTVKNCVSSNFGNEYIHAFRVLVSNDITQTGNNAVVDWYFYWNDKVRWKEVWAPDGWNNEYWYTLGITARSGIKPFDLSYNLKYDYRQDSHKYNNLSDYGYNTAVRNGVKGIVGSGGTASVNGFCNFWRALTKPGYKFGVFNLSYTGSFEDATAPCSDGTLGMPISGVSYASSGQDIEGNQSIKIGYDDGTKRTHAGTTSTDAVFNTLANGIKMWWFIL